MYKLIFLSTHSALNDYFPYTAPDDFLEQTGSLDLTSDASKQCISIPIIDDSVNEADQECFTFDLSESSGSEDLTLSPSTATICINDTDGKSKSWV